ncbi:MAG: sterol-binding protein [Thalassobius sp.]|nr:sterol-binding protein [Thalassovita sp.]
MELNSFTEKVKEIVASKPSLGSTLKFVFEEGVIFIDGTVEPSVVSNEDKEAACEIHVSMDDARAFLAGQLNPIEAMMEGNLKIEGDVAVAMKVVEIMTT